MELITKTEEGICIVQVQNQRIDAAAALAFKEAMRPVSDHPGPAVILDLGHVDFIDSSGLGAIVGTMKYLAPKHRLILAGLTPGVEKVFKLTQMNRVFDLFVRVEDALGAQRVGNH